MHALSFYKDWYHTRNQYSDIEELLADRTVQFYAAHVPDSMRDRIQQRLPELVARNQQQIEVPHFPLTEKAVGRLVERRREEIDHIKERGFDDTCKGLYTHKGYIEERIDGDFALIDTL
jgi:hypothetical protein